MKKRRSCLFVSLGVLFICLILIALTWKPFHLKPTDVNACSADSECVIVRFAGCGNPVAINRENIRLWDQYRKLHKYPFVIPIPLPIACAPSLPPEYFKAECLQNACQAVPIDEHAVLEFLQAPRLGEPANLVFRIRTVSGAENGHAKITFTPDLVTVNSGSLTWDGALLPATEEEYLVSVTFSRPGYYQIHGDATASTEGRQQSDIYFLLTESGVQYGARLENEWDILHQAFPVGEEDSRLLREFLFDPIPALNKQTTVVYRIRSSIDLGSADMQIVLPPAGFKLLDVTYPAGGEHGEFPQNVSVILPEGGKQKFSMPLQLWWRGPLRAGETFEIRATVKVIAQGWGTAYGEVRAAELPENVIYAFVYVDEYNGFYEIRDGP